MKLRKHFAGDVDSTLKRIQENSLPRLIEQLYTRPREQYLEEIRRSEAQNGELFEDVDDKLFYAIKDRADFDHDVLMPAYDRIAALYRFRRSDVWQTDLFPPDSASRRDPAARLERVRGDWEEFFDRECEAIAERDELARAVLNAVGFAGEDRGEDAVRALTWLLDKKYRSLTGARERWRSKT
ncbi:MAG: hypothetical protein ACOCR1_04795 [Planctomycetota bacterium]